MTREEYDAFRAGFKCSETGFAALKDLPGLRPAPYLASRGLTRVQRADRRTLGDAEREDYVRRNHVLVVAALPRKAQRELGLDQR